MKNDQTLGVQGQLACLGVWDWGANNLRSSLMPFPLRASTWSVVFVFKASQTFVTPSEPIWQSADWISGLGFRPQMPVVPPIAMEGLQMVRIWGLIIEVELG
jgi:hypothetical protein